MNLPNRKLLLGIVFAVAAFASFPRPIRAAGVTIISHGLNGNIDDWVIAMADRMAGYPLFPGTNSTCYAIEVSPNGSALDVTATRIGGSAPTHTDSGEILIKLDWRDLADNDYSTFQVATAVVPRLLQTNFIAELNGHALAELPLHLIGHSRGGSLMCQISRLLGTNGVWVDHLTTLDPHPLNNDGFNDFPYTVVDAPARTFENVLFHDNYFQEVSLLAYGEAVAGAFVRELTNLDGGYSGLFSSHSDVHLWYHGTVDLRVPAGDTVATITSAERQAWWTPAEGSGRYAGFYYSRIGGGDRSSTNRPAGGSRIRDGYNQRWDLGAGLANNRTALNTNNGNWPSLIRFDLTGTNSLFYSQTTSVTLFYQFARPASSNATADIFLDEDANPFNGNERLIRALVVNGTGSTNVGQLAVPIGVSATNAPAGEYSLFARIVAGERSRVLYAPQSVVIAGSNAPALDIARGGDGLIRVGVNGTTGQAVVLQHSMDLRTWEPIETNILAGGRWVFTTAQPAEALFFRAKVLE